MPGSRARTFLRNNNNININRQLVPRAGIDLIMGAGASVSVGANEVLEVSLKGLPGALDRVFQSQKWPLILDEEGLAQSYLTYQSGSLLCYRLAGQGDMAPERLRRALVSSLKTGTQLTIAFKTLDGASFEACFSPDHFPASILEPGAALKETFWSPILRPDQGDPETHMFAANPGFCFCVLSETEYVPPGYQAHFRVIRVASSNLEQETPTPPPKKGPSITFSEAVLDMDIDKVREAMEKVGKAAVMESINRQLNEEGQTMLMLAALHNKGMLVELLLSYGADPNACGPDGRTALFLSTVRGSVSLIESLIQHGAHVEARDHNEKTPLLFAVSEAKSPAEAAGVLLDRGHVDLAATCKQGMNALHWAAARPDKETVEILLQHGAQISTRARLDGFTALLYAAQQGAWDVVKVLAKAASPEDLCACDPESGTGVLHMVAESANSVIADVLIQKGGERLLNSQDKEGKTPLMASAARGDRRMIELMLSKGAHADLTHKDGKTAADFAKGDELKRLLKEAAATQASSTKTRAVAAPAADATAGASGTSKGGKAKASGSSLKAAKGT